MHLPSLTCPGRWDAPNAFEGDEGLDLLDPCLAHESVYVYHGLVIGLNLCIALVGRTARAAAC